MAETVPGVFYATDEDLARYAPGDFPILAPQSQRLAYGTDGVLASGTPWALTSATDNFQAQGVAPGNVVLLKGAPIKGTELYGVAAAAGSTLTLRRIGLGTAAGVPPAPGGATGLTFEVRTLQGQIELATYDLNQRFGVDDLVYGRRSNDLYDPTEVRQVCCYLVLWRQYDAMSRNAGDASDDLAAKAKRYRADYETALAAAAPHWQVMQGVPAASDLFSARLTR